MLCGVIDLGSNTMRLTVYRIKDKSFNILFNQKEMAGIAGYVNKGVLSEDGIAKACLVLNNFKAVFENFEIDNTFVFATASLRNIKNTDEAVLRIFKETGFKVEVISGEDEAILDFEGATHNVDMKHGLLVDIGGGSTELVTYNNSEIISPASADVGSLSLYSKCVEKVLPKKIERKKMKKMIQEELYKIENIEDKKYEVICGVGGTIRAALKLNNYMFSLPSTNRSITTENLRYILDTLCENNTTALNLILKICPDRIHTIIPGLEILKFISKKYKSDIITVSTFGVREGYLCRKII